MRWAWSARCRLTQPSLPGSGAWPAQITSPLLVSSSRIARLVVADPARQDERLQGARRHRAARELVDRRHHAVDAAELAADALPRRQEPGQRLVRDRLDLLAQPGQRPPAELAQHLGVAPLRPAAGRAELALEQSPAGDQALQRLPGDGFADARAGSATSAVVNGPWVRA